MCAPASSLLQGDACISCGAQVHYSPLTWDMLPLVEFELEEGLGEEEAQVSPSPMLRAALLLLQGGFMVPTDGVTSSCAPSSVFLCAIVPCAGTHRGRDRRHVSPCWQVGDMRLAML